MKSQYLGEGRHHGENSKACRSHPDIVRSQVLHSVDPAERTVFGPLKPRPSARAGDEWETLLQFV